MLSYAVFRRRFGSDPHVIGTTITLNGWPFTIAGVLPKDFRFLFPQQWIPGDERRDIDAYIAIPDALMRLAEISWQLEEAALRRLGPAPHALCVIGKRRQNVPFERAHAEMQAIYNRVARETYPDWKREFVTVRIAPLKEKIVGNARRALMVLLAAVGFVLLIATANIANLLLARASTRQREVAIRAAIGAGRMRVVRQFLTESVLLAVVGGAAGLALAQWGLAVLIRLGSNAVPRLALTANDGCTVLFTLAVSFATGVVFGLGPAVSMWRSDLHECSKMTREHRLQAPAGFVFEACWWRRNSRSRSCYSPEPG